MIDDIAAVAAEGRPATLRPQPLEMAGREAEIMSGLACVQEWAGPARTHSFVFHRASFDAVAPGRWGAAVIGEATALAEARKSTCPTSGLATGQWVKSEKRRVGNEWWSTG